MNKHSNIHGQCNQSIAYTTQINKKTSKNTNKQSHKTDMKTYYSTPEMVKKTTSLVQQSENSKKADTTQGKKTQQQN